MAKLIGKLILNKRMNNFSIYQLVTVLFIFMLSCNKQSASMTSEDTFQEITSLAKQTLKTDSLSVIPNLTDQPTYYLCYPKVEEAPGSIQSFTFLVINASTKQLSTKEKVFNGKVLWKNANTIEVVEKKGIDQNGSNTTVREITIK